MTGRVAVAGAGLAGCTAARLFADAGYTVFVYEKDRIGGLCADTIHQETGLRYSLYGPHIFHTNVPAVWQFMNRFSKWVEFEHFVIADTGSTLVRLPVDMVTIHHLCVEDGTVMTPRQLANLAGPVRECLWSSLWKHYSERQWLREFDNPEDCCYIGMRQVQTLAGGNYFNSRYCAVPADGYETLFRNMLAHGNITVIHEEYTMDTPGEYDFIFYSGRPDRLLGYRYGTLPYIDHKFTLRVVPSEDTQGCFVKNWTGPQHRILRSTDYSMNPALGLSSPPLGLVVDEVSVKDGDLYGMYPFRDEVSEALWSRYAASIGIVVYPDRRISPRVSLIGRQGRYRYMDMDAVVNDTMDTVYNLVPGTRPPTNH